MSLSGIDLMTDAELEAACKRYAPDFAIKIGEHKDPREPADLAPEKKVGASYTTDGKPWLLELIATRGKLSIETARRSVLEGAYRTLVRLAAAKADA